MKTTLTIEQSAELIKRGVSADKASMSNTTMQAAVDARGIARIPRQPIFTLADLLSLLPKKIDDSYHLKIQSCDWPTWTVCYIDFQSGAKGWRQSMELIDALYKLLLWAIDNNHVKLD